MSGKKTVKKNNVQEGDGVFVMDGKKVVLRSGVQKGDFITKVMCGQYRNTEMVDKGFGPVIESALPISTIWTERTEQQP